MFLTSDLGNIKIDFVQTGIQHEVYLSKFNSLFEIVDDLFYKWLKSKNLERKFKSYALLKNAIKNENVSNLQKIVSFSHISNKFFKNFSNNELISVNNVQ